MVEDVLRQVGWIGAESTALPKRQQEPLVSIKNGRHGELDFTPQQNTPNWMMLDVFMMARENGTQFQTCVPLISR